METTGSDHDKSEMNEDDLLKSPHNSSLNGSPIGSPSRDSEKTPDGNSPLINTEEIPSNQATGKINRKIVKYLRDLSSLYNDLTAEGSVAGLFQESEAEAVIKSVIESIDTIKGKYSELHEKLRSHLDTGAAYDEANEKRNIFLDLHRSIKFKLLRLIKPASAATNDSDNSASVNSYLRVKFPKLELRTFGGKADDWVDWSRLYTSMVHNKQDMAAYDKHQFLRTKLAGEAEVLVRGYPIEGNTYDTVWKLLCDTYGQPTKNITQFLRAIDDLEPMSQDEPNSTLRNLITNFRANSTAIELTLREHPEIDGMALVLTYMFLKKADQETKVDWEREVSRNKEIVPFASFLDYMNERCGALERGADDKGVNKSKKRPPPSTSNSKKALVLPAKKPKVFTPICRFCNDEHKTHECKIFTNKNASDRLAFVKEKGLCFRCLRTFQPGHHRQCKFRCKECKQGHNPLLHEAFDKMKSSTMKSSTYLSLQTPMQIDENLTNSNECVHRLNHGNTNNAIDVYDGTKTCTKISNEDNSFSLISVIDNNKYSCTLSSSTSTSDGWVGTLSDNEVYELLATAIIEIEGVQVRTLLDSCSQFNIISTELVNRLNLKRERGRNVVGGVGNASTTSSGTVKVFIRSLCTNFKCTIRCIILDEIVSDVPSRFFPIDNWKMPDNIRLADPQFNRPAQVDLLLGTGVFWNTLLPEYLRLSQGYPRFQNTKFGWIVTGDLNIGTCNAISRACYVNIESLDRLSQTIEKLWLLDETINKTLSEEERDCEAHYLANTTRNSEGRFVLRLPWKFDRKALGHSKTQALKRFHALERRFSRDTKFRDEYAKCINEMISEGQLRQAVEIPGEECYYIPHHAVIKESSSTTKLRIVLDPTMKSSTGLSLSDCLMKGPTVQAPLRSILFRSRIYRFVFTTDVRKLYLQFLRHLDEVSFQRILWRESPNDPITIFEFLVVVFGFPSSPYEATRSLKYLAEKYRDQFPLACTILEEDTYVDDVYSGADTIEEAIEKRNQLIELVKLAGLELSKWCSNSSDILEDLGGGNNSTIPIQLEKGIAVKTLGLKWLPCDDEYRVWVGQYDLCTNWTKRLVLSIISSIYDPLGFLGPVTVSCKIIMQLLWKDKQDWDSPLSKEIKQKWTKLISSLRELNKIIVPRYLFDKADKYRFLELHGFADASQDAYGAVVYLRAVYENRSVITLLTSKSRVAPLKKVDISRLELCAAELLSNLMEEALGMFGNRLKFSAIRLWTDNTITLFWIRSPASKWEIFVANRVRRIQSITKEYTWDYVNTKENPADPLSRGVKPQELKDLSLWWEGPPSLSTGEPTNPGSKYKFTESVTLELKRPSHKLKNALILVQNNSWMEGYVSLDALVRSVAHQCRFIWNSHWYGPRIFGQLQLHEYNNALLLIIKLVQKEVFREELTCIEHNKDIPVKSPISRLFPFVDGSGVLRVGGRLRNSELSFEQRHPILLPPNHHVTRLLVKQEHVRQLHAGPTALKSVLRRKYWIIHTNNAVRYCILHCRKCILAKKETRTQLMAALPRARVIPQRPFTVTGVDYAGPINLLVKKRPHTVTKAYIAVFVCFSVKAIHIELVSDLTSESFIAAFNRFISRRGLPTEMNSDNGTNFIGAKRILSDLGKCLQNKDISKFWTSSGVNWKLIPPYAPHFGGLWEAGVKSIKSHLAKVIGDRELTYEQYETTLIQIEACLNSRPLCPESSDPNELNALTPGHFLIGGPITALPNTDLTNVPVNRLKYWEQTKQLTQQFWKRWKNEYLNTLQERNKWRFVKNNVKVGDLVAINDDSLPPTRWLTGRIVELHQGSDDLVRVISVNTGGNNIVTRAIKRVTLLPVEDD